MSGLTLIECDLKDTAKVLEKLNSGKKKVLKGLIYWLIMQVPAILGRMRN